MIYARLDKAPKDHDPRDYRLVEVNWKMTKIAQSLIKLGLAVEDWPNWADDNTHLHIRLPEADELFLQT